MTRAFLMTLLLGGCLPDAPAAPSFQLDVMPILAANCVRCHGSPPIGGAPEAFRLDSYDSVTIRSGEVRESVVCGGDPSDPAAAIVVCGASTYAQAIARRTAGIGAPMPPRFGLGDYERATLANWAENPVRGPTRPDNHIPSVTMDIGASALRLLVRDDDGDLVAGELRVDSGDDERVIGMLHAGQVEIATPALAPGPHPLRARVDDGAGSELIELGLLEVP